jgi:hypothetical protein
VFEEWVPEASVFDFGLCRSSQKGSAVKNLAGALHADRVGCTLSVAWEVKMKIPVKSIDGSFRLGIHG